MSHTILCGDAITRLRELPDESVQCVVTSPPYWGLRDYGTGQWTGGAPGCDHVYNHGQQGKSGERATRTFTASAIYKTTCGRCGAARVDEQIGIEGTLEEYLSALLCVFREVRRVLRDDGTLWLNLGDSYCADAGTVRERGLKPKDLCMLPARVAIALQADGWYLRSDIIWHKPNPMPESVADRPTKAHEYLFLLAKSPRYYYDAKAIRELASDDSHAHYARGRSDNHKWADGGPGNQTIATNRPGSRFGKTPQDQAGVNPKCAEPGSGIKQNSSFSATVKDIVEFRNKRSVWTIPTQPYSGAHFATFPEDLVWPCILAGTRQGDTVLDPFSGAGTVGFVCQRSGNPFIGIELNPEYCAMAERRLAQTALDFGGGETWLINL